MPPPEEGSVATATGGHPKATGVAAGSKQEM